MLNISQKLSKAHPIVFSLYVMIAAAGTYFCMYAFRKPFSAFTYDETLWVVEIAQKSIQLSMKDWFIMSQILGYTLSKFYGIKFIAELMQGKRIQSILLLILFSWVALFFFAFFENKALKVVSLFFNGLPLGLIWGLVFSFLEGRKLTDLLGAGLSVSFVFASGFMKTFTRWLDQLLSVETYWLPFLVGFIFIFPLLFFVYLLSQVPPASEEDELLRTKRAPMNKTERKGFLNKYGFIVALSTIVYVFLSLIRSIREDYAVDIWKQLNMSEDPSIFLKTEIPVTLILLLLVGSMFIIKNNKLALLFNYGLIVLGFLVLIASNFLFQMAYIGPVAWMISIGVGLYMAYIPFNCIIFERMLAYFQFVGTAGFLIYIADAWGYLAIIGILITKNFSILPESNWYEIFSTMVYVLGTLGAILSFVAWMKLYKHKNIGKMDTI